MNYRHIYHAGNFADVFKHWILTLLLNKLSEKSTPFFVLDTHAGLGLYDLQHENAQKTLEYQNGIEMFLQNEASADVFQQYKKIVAGYLQGKIYPGSPAIIQEFLRENDRAFLCELHPEDYKQLQQNFAKDKHIKTFQQDGYLGLKSFLPPKERRGLILIDPPFEKTNELEMLISAVQEGLKRFATGIYAIWYPIKDLKMVNKLYKHLQALQVKAAYMEIYTGQPIDTGLQACGMVIINPPWQIDELIQQNLPRLLDSLHIPKANHQFGWLT